MEHGFGEKWAQAVGNFFSDLTENTINLNQESNIGPEEFLHYCEHEYC